MAFICSFQIKTGDISVVSVDKFRVLWTMRSFHLQCFWHLDNWHASEQAYIPGIMVCSIDHEYSSNDTYINVRSTDFAASTVAAIRKGISLHSEIFITRFLVDKIHSQQNAVARAPIVTADVQHCSYNDAHSDDSHIITLTRVVTMQKFQLNTTYIPKLIFWIILHYSRECVEFRLTGKEATHWKFRVFDDSQLDARARAHVVCFVQIHAHHTNKHIKICVWQMVS